MPKIEKNNLIPREIFPQLISHLQEPEISLLVGARQTGKTVLLGMIKEYLLKEKKVSPCNVLYFNLDIIKDWEFFQDQTKFIKFLKERTEKGKVYLLVDEAQRVPECTRFFKGVYDSDLNVKMILSGSASLELKTRLKESMTGRKRIFRLF
ncbi:AAA family ATPase, partial [bacterium]|nr:AAA family ATPase [bacterium]